jgi:hypothetical protein
MSVVNDTNPLTDRMSRERLAELVSAASYGCVLVLAALSVIGVSEVALGHGAELVAGVGLATWLAHLFAELLGAHVKQVEPMHRRELRRAAADGSPILAAPVLPAIVLLLGRLDVISDDTARVIAIVVAVVQLLFIGVFVARVSPARAVEGWSFALATVGIGVVVVALTLLLGH